MRENRILRKPELVKLVGLSHVTIWRMERLGQFPKRVQLGAKAVGWWASEIVRWIESRESV